MRCGWRTESAGRAGDPLRGLVRFAVAAAAPAVISLGIGLVGIGLVSLALAAGSLGGCGGGQTVAGANGALTWQQTREGVTCSVVLEPGEPRAMQSAELRVALHDMSGGEIGGVTVGFMMPGMRMAPNEPALKEGPADVFTGRALLPMSGDWRLRVQTAQVRFSFPVHCR